MHQPSSSSARRNSTIRERGEEVIAREQARAASQRLHGAVERYEEDEFERADEAYVGPAREEGRRGRRDRRRERPPQQFWR